MSFESHPSPFALDQDQAYRAWRRRKLADFPHSIEELKVRVRDPGRPDDDEKTALLQACRRANLTIYQGPELAEGEDKTILRALARSLGLERLERNLLVDDDGIARLRDLPTRRHGEYIPYTNKALNWHTDGYYNDPKFPVRAIVMHCVADAGSGGANAYIDHELLYIRLRDQAPKLLEALMHPNAMTIPANVENGREVRPAVHGPVFSVATDGRLHMRYTARTRSINWRDDPDTREAVRLLSDLLNDTCAHTFHYRLRPGEGVICNNVLHRREAFTDTQGSRPQRELLRARFHDRLAHT